MTDDQALALANEALTHWNGTRPQLISNRENAVFKAQTPEGSIALRLHRIGYQSQAHIEGELVWTTALAAQGFPCPTPIPTRNGAVTRIISSGHVVSAIAWIDAQPVGQDGTSMPNAPAQMEKTGQLLAQLHNLTDQQSATLSRPSWDADALLGDDPHWGRFWENPALTHAERQTALDMRAQAKEALSALSTPDIGLIHADVLQENILQSANGLHLIDFDDSGTGYRLYDLGTALIQHVTARDFAEIQAALWQGYATYRQAPLPAASILPLFTMLRGMASAGWVISRAPSTAKVHRIYADRMLRCIQLYRAQ